MKIGDLVRLTSPQWGSLGLVISVTSEYLVEVLWAGKEYAYMEAISNLEVVQ